MKSISEMRTEASWGSGCENLEFLLDWAERALPVLLVVASLKLGESLGEDAGKLCEELLS